MLHLQHCNTTKTTVAATLESHLAKSGAIQAIESATWPKKAAWPAWLKLSFESRYTSSQWE